MGGLRWGRRGPGQRTTPRPVEVSGRAVDPGEVVPARTTRCAPRARRHGSGESIPGRPERSDPAARTRTTAQAAWNRRGGAISGRPELGLPTAGETARGGPRPRGSAVEDRLGQPVRGYDVQQVEDKAGDADIEASSIPAQGYD